jgi:hypothetical protein
MFYLRAGKSARLRQAKSACADSRQSHTILSGSLSSPRRRALHSLSLGIYPQVFASHSSSPGISPPGFMGFQAASTARPQPIQPDPQQIRSRHVTRQARRLVTETALRPEGGQKHCARAHLDGECVAV